MKQSLIVEIRNAITRMEQEVGDEVAKVDKGKGKETEEETVSEERSRYDDEHDDDEFLRMVELAVQRSRDYQDWEESQRVLPSSYAGPSSSQAYDSGVDLGTFPDNYYYPMPDTQLHTTMTTPAPISLETSGTQSTQGNTSMKGQKTRQRLPRLKLSEAFQMGLARIGEDGEFELQCTKESHKSKPPKWRKLSDFPPADPETGHQVRRCTKCKEAVGKNGKKGRKGKKGYTAPQNDETDEEEQETIIPGPDHWPGLKRRRDDDDDDDRDERGKPASGRVPPFANYSQTYFT